MLPILLSIIVFIFGLLVGSFLNCVLYRLKLQAGLPKGSTRRKAVSFLRGKSFCPYCKHILKWYDLIPVFSFILLRRKCRYCGKKISWQYPVVEIATGILAFLISYFLFLNHFLFLISYLINFVFLFSISCFLLIIFVYDLKHYIIPDKVIYPAIAVVLIYLLFENLNIGNWLLIENWKLIIENFAGPLLAAIGGSSFFFLIWLLSKGQWMGFGDVKLAFFMGLFLGFPNILVALFSAFLIGAIIGLSLIAMGKKKLKSQVPFGPFLIIGTFIALFLGEKIVSWYLSLIMG